MPDQALYNLGFADRFADEIIAAFSEYLGVLPGQDAGRYGNHYGVLTLSGRFDALYRFVTVHYRHAHVHPDEVGLPCLPDLQRLQTVLGRAHRKA